MKITIDQLKQYIKNVYKVDGITIIDNSNRNQVFDLYCNDKSFNMSIEIKERFFTDMNKKYMNMDDILIELVQHWYNFGTDIDNNINTVTNSAKINTSIGWFYKCNADRLLYIKWYHDKVNNIYDINFKLFKNWLLDRMGNYELQWCGKTTQTVNLIVPISSVPDTIVKKFTDSSGRM